MAKSIDLHIHSNYSEDADYSVEELFTKAGEAGLDGISITDHDSVESAAGAGIISKACGINYITGVEITTVFSIDGSQQHLLGYFIDPDNTVLQNTLKKIQDFRINVARKRISALKEIGFHLNESNIWSMAGGRTPTATSIMVEVLNNSENSKDSRLDEYFHGSKKDNRLSFFYREFFLEGKPAYVPFESIDMEEGIKTIIEAGGLPVLAHPKFVKNNMWLDIIREYGISGIEAISTYHNDEDIKYYLAYAKTNGLLITAGSDFHGPTSKPKVMLGGISGNDYSYLEALYKAAGR